jgi:Ion channel
MVKLFAIVIFMVHLYGCLWYFNSSLLLYNSKSNWIALGGWIDSDNLYKYLISLYWTTYTIGTIGYGDIAIGDVSEYLMAIFWMAFGASFYSYLVGTIT